VIHRNIASVVSILSQNYIYFGKKQSPIISIYNKTSYTPISSYRLQGPGTITNMAMFASEVQPSTTSK